jgi:cysteine desulfurase family protein
MIYFDNAATSYPKPAEVIKAVINCLEKVGANPGRGAHRLSLEAGRIIFEAREEVASFFKVDDSKNIIFTPNCTSAINLALKGLLRTGDHVVTTSMEHNSVLRPLKALEKMGVQTTKVFCQKDGTISIPDVEAAIQSNTRLLVVTAASNVTGTLMPLRELSQLTKQKGIIFMVDAAQVAGHMPIDVKELGIDLLAFPGHKGLLGPQGTGGLYISPDLEILEIMQGGTGSNSESEEQPRIRPERYESGTLNTPGLAGLAAGIKFIKRVGIEAIYEKERRLIKQLLEDLFEIKGITIYGPGLEEKRAAVVSINLRGLDSNELAFILDQNFGIASRSGLHCAAAAHRTIGTIETGTVRLSPGYFNTEAEAKSVIKAIATIAKDFV